VLIVSDQGRNYIHLYELYQILYLRSVEANLKLDQKNDYFMIFDPVNQDGSTSRFGIKNF
jgi:hypothetical protein